MIFKPRLEAGSAVLFQDVRKTAFLPALQEIEQTAPAPLGRAVAWIITSLIVIAFGLSLCRIDVAAIARGKLIPSGQVKVLQPFEAGIVKAIHVAEGQHVIAGQLLVELDSSVSQADLHRIHQELHGVRSEIARLKEQADLSGNARSHHGDVRQSYLSSTLESEHRAKLDAIEGDIASAAAEVRIADATIEKIESMIPIINERHKTFSALVARGYVTKIEYLAVEQERIEAQNNLVAERARRERALAVVAQSKAHRASFLSEYRRSALERLEEQEVRAKVLEQDLVKAGERTGWQNLVAPVTGTAQQLTIHTIGGVVEAGKPLLTIVPDDQRLMVEARLPNKDIGYVKVGQRGRIKVETFPFTRYGTIEASIVDISDDAVQTDDAGLVFTVQASVDRDAMWIDGRDIQLSPGMVVDLEVNIGSRRVIDFFLSPVMKKVSESVRER